MALAVAQRALLSLALVAALSGASRISQQELAPGGFGDVMSGMGQMVDGTMVSWQGIYGDCDSTCGSGWQKLEGMTCHHVLKGPQPDSVCESFSVPRPLATRQCVDLSTCQWQCTPREDGCGWPEVSSTACVDTWQPDTKLDTHYCATAEHLASAAEFTRDECRQTACSGVMPSTARVVTANHLDTRLSTTGESGLLPVVREAYEGEDLVVVATQELVGSKFSKRVTPSALSDLGLVLVASCSADVSAGVALYAKSSVRHLYAPISDPCVERSGQSSWSNTKGTMVMVVQTVFKSLALASTHGARAGTFSEERLSEFQDAAAAIMGAATALRERDGGEAAIFWGGDFNPRTHVTQESTLHSGTTHPERRDVTDKYPRANFDPSAAFGSLQAVRQSADIFGGSQHGGAPTVAELLQIETQNHPLSEVPGLEKLCPSYYKTPNPGSVNTPFKLWGKKESTWDPSWACLAPGSTELEYYDRSKWNGNEPKARTPSWPDRIFTNAMCRSYQKVIQKEDHDVMHAHCEF